uniref:ATP synthase F0 subunit 8 n=1 Tax=Malawimonas jakobiformis TaxID=136089 RepID=Q9G878_MALJA|nr:ATP synthase F0 subunit 8 [Malawimonas jakobiformis]AAG13695.1 ATP synthase F0 subunit 8 [Malawimonas jakobiformis]
MPQLDNVTFLSQIFWCFITFSLLYFIVLKNILPNIAKVLKIRKKLFDYYNSLFNNINTINNNYIVFKSSDISNLFFIINKNINDYNEIYKNINNNSYISNNIRNYSLLNITRKLSKVITNGK